MSQQIEQEITTTEMAEIAGVTVQAVTNWKTRHSDFPKRIRKHRRTEIFKLTEYVIWLDKYNARKQR